MDTVVETELSSEESTKKASDGPRALLTSEQSLAASTASSSEIAPESFGPEAKHFTEIRVLNRDVSLLLSLCWRLFNFISYVGSDLCWILQVQIILEGVDKFSNLIGSVYYPDGDSAKDLPLELVENVCSVSVKLQALPSDNCTVYTLIIKKNCCSSRKPLRKYKGSA